MEHAHEEIDGEFGTKWQYTKLFNILTPQMQAELTVVAFKELISRGFWLNVEGIIAFYAYFMYDTMIKFQFTHN